MYKRQVKRILSDQGKQFQNVRWSTTLETNGIQPILTAIRRPQGNLAERVNKELGRLFRTYCHGIQNMWPDYIRFFEQSLNENYNTTTGFTPTELHSGKQPTRFWERHIKKLESQNLPIPMHIKQSIAKTRIEQTADQRARVFNLSLIHI